MHSIFGALPLLHNSLYSIMLALKLTISCRTYRIISMCHIILRSLIIPHDVNPPSVRFIDTHTGGVGIGRLLIMRVAQELAQQFPSAHTFSTLSPVPRFTKWLRKAAVQLQESEDAVAKLLAEAVENETDVIDTRGDRHRHSHDRQDQAPEVASALSHSNTHSHAQGGSRGGHAPFLIPAEYLEQLKLAAGHDLATRASISEIDSWAGKPVTAAEALTWLVDKLEGFDDDKNNWVEDLVVSGLIKEPVSGGVIPPTPGREGGGIRSVY